MEQEVIAAVAQFGAAGLIGWMWLSERRAAAERERQLSELHARVMDDRTSLSVLVGALSDNTRALAALEAGQRELVRVLAAHGDDRGTEQTARRA
ncbi:MAG: hypothetical protein SFY96_11200 [Planctomycetota bacterium]|nr:hypothetical protein [Planctomycetota bacterium]